MSSVRIVNQASATASIPYPTGDPSAIPIEDSIAQDPDVLKLWNRVDDDFLFLATQAFGKFDQIVAPLSATIYQEVENDQSRTPQWKMQREGEIRTAAVRMIEATWQNCVQRRDAINATLDSAVKTSIPKDPTAALVYLQQYQILRDRYLRVLERIDGSGPLLQRMVELAKEAAESGNPIAIEVVRQELPAYYEGKHTRMMTGQGEDAIAQQLLRVMVPALPPVERAVAQLRAALAFGWPHLEARYQSAIREASNKDATRLDAYPGWAGNTISVRRFG